MRNFFFLMLLIPVLSFAQVNGEEKKPETGMAPVEVFAVDFKGKELNNEIIVFRSKLNGKEYSGLTDSTGYFELSLPAGDDYEIFILGFKDSTSYNVLKIPALAENQVYNESFIVDIKFQPANTFVLEDVNFNTGKATLLPESYAAIDELIKYLNRKDDERIEIGGHTDNVGKADANLKLSLERANSVRDYVLSRGIDPGRITAKGYGSTKPVADNKTEEGRAINRRTEVTILE